jgi:hypothetical protein
LAIDALVKLLIVEPTEIWSEVARALGDAGAQAAVPLAAMLREVSTDERDRIVEALAHVAARGGRPPVEGFASDRDVLVATAARRALKRVDDVRSADDEVRRARTEQTVVRGFSRRFYDVLSGEGSGPVELDPGDIEEIEVVTPVAATPGDEPHEPIPTLVSVPPTAMSEAESTNPTPKSTLPRTRG